MNKLRFLASVLPVLGFLAATAQAATVGIINPANGQLSDVNNPIEVTPGLVINLQFLQLVGRDFPATDAGDFTLTFDTPGVASFAGFDAANPPWETSQVGLIPGTDVLFFVGTSGTPPSGVFDIGTLVLNIIGPPGSMTILDLADGLSGWSGPSGPINVNYVDAKINVVPLPAAAWLMLSAVGVLIGAGGARRRSGRPGQSGCGSQKLIGAAIEGMWTRWDRANHSEGSRRVAPR